MIDIKFLRENLTLVKENIKHKFQESKLNLLDEFVELDIIFHQNLSKINELVVIRDKISVGIKNKMENELSENTIDLDNEIKKINQEQDKIKLRFDEIVEQIPNIISDDTPIGKDENFNKEIGNFGKKHIFNFSLKNHIDLAENLNVVDFDSSRNLSGQGFYYLKADLALLNQALIAYAEDFMQKQGHLFIAPPFAVNKKACDGVISFNDFKDSIYKIENNDLYLIGSSELSLIAMLTNKVIDEEKLPLKLFSFSACFRLEKGSHGVNERGLFRVHQFDKVEQIIICKPTDSDKYFNDLLFNQKTLLLDLGFNVRYLQMCSGDLGDWKKKQVDIEVWSPIRNKYIELGSCSNLTETQAIGSNICAKTKCGDKYHVHTLNCTAISITRTLVAILENFQTEAGTIKIPEILQPYMYGKTEIKKNESF
ncbi:MAG: serine--tRNA ligase [archaeon]